MEKYICGDIHEIIKDISDNSIDFIYTDPPFGITKAEWDKPLRWKELFPEMWRVLKPKGVIVLYASMPFTYELLKYEKPKYHYCWWKNKITNFLHAKRQPLRDIEEIFVYYKKAGGTYNPQMVGTEFRKKTNKHGTKSNYYSHRKTPKLVDEEKGHYGKYPRTLKKWNTKTRDGISRCDDQIDFFIKTYSNKGDTILNMTCNNKVVGDRVKKLERSYIGVDLIKI